MIIVNQHADATGLEQEVSRIERQLREITHELEQLQERIREGQVGSESEASKIFSDIRRWIRLAIETENSLAERKKARRGSAADYELDLNKARDSIGCRLDRLRRCCHSK